MSDNQLGPDTCLQCGQTRAGVKRDETFCGVEEGYEHMELGAEWPRHHWRDWSNTELNQAGINPDVWDSYRRVSVFAFDYPPCADRQRGHTPAARTDPDGWFVAGKCVDCGEMVNEPETLAA